MSKDSNSTAGAEKKPEGGTTEAKAPKAAQSAADRKVRVAKGRSVTSKRGIIGPGEEVEARDFSGGQATLDTLVRKGVLEAR